ncbi:hypothetical protein [Martelella alba]|uniref:Uncharacterized protein n=1 Tax=Martelella alba TaxID=2590451 RepID=A0ABY2SFA9_9HYPH|nr:hypothetical protein [Martelella alba]TKI03579.1 hypothetical protein FCN80_21105 [Martelella alba]
MKVKINEIDDSQVTGAAPEVKKNEVIDSRGRVIKVRDLGPLEESRVLLIVGPQASVNMAYLNAYVFPAAKVESIDGDPYPIPQTQAQIDAVLKILGREGMSAVLDLIYPKESTDNNAEDAAAKN